MTTLTPEQEKAICAYLRTSIITADQAGACEETEMTDTLTAAHKYFAKKVDAAVEENFGRCPNYPWFWELLELRDTSAAALKSEKETK